MIVRLGENGHLYDLSDGSLSMDPIGVIKTTDEEVYSAEQLLNDICELNIGFRVTLIVTGFTYEDMKEVSK